MENGIKITKNNFCEITALAFVSLMSSLILNDRDVLQFQEFGMPNVEILTVLVVFLVMLGLWAGCRWIRIKIP